MRSRARRRCARSVISSGVMPSTLPSVLVVASYPVHHRPVAATRGALPVLLTAARREVEPVVRADQQITAAVTVPQEGADAITPTEPRRRARTRFGSRFPRGELSRGVGTAMVAVAEGYAVRNL